MAGPNTKPGVLALAAIPAVGVVLTLAVFNVAGWAVRWQEALAIALLFCGISFFCEFLGFALAIAAEHQIKAGRKDRFVVCVYSLAVCAIVNVGSGHNAWETFEGMMTAPQARIEQAGLDHERGAILSEIAGIDRQLDGARPAPQTALGPQSRAEAREVYQLEIARLQPRRERLQARLDAMPVVAPERHMIPPILVWIAFGLIEAMKALVLWGIGVGDIGARVRSAIAGAALSAQEAKDLAPPPERPLYVDAPLPQELVLDAGDGGRALLDKLVENNVVTMSDVASKHAARPRPGARRKAA